MPRHARTKVKKIDVDLNIEELNDVFNQMTGECDPDVSIVYPKYVDIIAKLKQFKQCCESLIELLKSDDKQYDEVLSFAAQIETIIANEKIQSDFESQHYLDLAKGTVVEQIVETCSKFAPIYIHLEKEWSAVDRKFMNRVASISFSPLAFSDVDFKHLYLVEGDQDEEVQECVFTVLRGMFLSSYKIYKISTSPNIDKNYIAQLMINSISKLKPHIPGCRDVFDKIESSVGLFENNFDSYYKDFLQSGDNTALFTSFLSDVAKDNKKTDIKLLVQCRKLIKFLRDNSRSNGGPTSKHSAIGERIFNCYTKIENELEKYRKMAKAETNEDNSDEGDVEEQENDNEEDLPELDDLMKQINNPKIKEIKK